MGMAANFTASDAAQHTGDLGNVQNNGLDRLGSSDCLFQTDIGIERRLEVQSALFQVGDVLSAHREDEDHSCCRYCVCDHEDAPSVPAARREERQIDLLRPSNYEWLFGGYTLFAQHIPGYRRNRGQCEENRTSQREGNCKSHRPKHDSFHSGECENGEEYYEYVLLYTDNCLVISERANSVLRGEIGKYFELKEESIGKPSQYLGGILREVELENGATCWAFGSTQYVKAAVMNAATYLKKKGLSLPAKAPNPLKDGYRPEIDLTSELKGDDAWYYHSLIGVL